MDVGMLIAGMRKVQDRLVDEEVPFLVRLVITPDSGIIVDAQFMLDPTIVPVAWSQEGDIAAVTETLYRIADNPLPMLVQFMERVSVFQAYMDNLMEADAEAAEFAQALYEATAAFREDTQGGLN